MGGAPRRPERAALFLGENLWSTQVQRPSRGPRDVFVPTRLVEANCAVDDERSCSRAGEANQASKALATDTLAADKSERRSSPVLGKRPEPGHAGVAPDKLGGIVSLHAEEALHRD